MTRLVCGSSARLVVLLACFITGAVVAQSGEGESGTLDVRPLILPGGGFPYGVYASNYTESEENDDGNYYYNNSFYPQNDSMAAGEEGNISSKEHQILREMSCLAASQYRHLYPQSPSVCMPTVFDDGIEVDYTTRISVHQQRRVLSIGELESEPARKAVMHSVKFFIQTNNGTRNLEMTELKSGCRQNYASGELLFLVFGAKETLICDLTAVNTTCTENTMRTVECRARVYFSTSNVWNPFYTSCHLPTFYEIDRQGVKIKYL